MCHVGYKVQAQVSVKEPFKHDWLSFRCVHSRVFTNFMAQPLSFTLSSLAFYVCPSPLSSSSPSSSSSVYLIQLPCREFCEWNLNNSSISSNRIIFCPSPSPLLIDRSPLRFNLLIQHGHGNKVGPIQQQQLQISLKQPPLLEILILIQILSIHRMTLALACLQSNNLRQSFDWLWSTFRFNLKYFYAVDVEKEII